MDISDSSTDSLGSSKPTKEDVLSDSNCSSSNILEDENTNIQFDDIPLGMTSFPMNPSLTLPHGILIPQVSLSENPFGNSPFPSYRIDELLPNTNSLDATTFSMNCFASVNSCSSFEAFSASKFVSNQKESSSCDEKPSVSFATCSIDCGPLPQGYIRNNPQIMNTTKDCVVSKMDYDFPILPCNTISMFDPSFVPESIDIHSDSNFTSENESSSSSSSDSHSLLHSCKKKTSQKKTKKWSCSNCRYMNNMSISSSIRLRNRDKEMS